MQHSFQEATYEGPKRLCFPDLLHFSKKIGVLGARLGARNFTRALGYAKCPLSVALAFAGASFRILKLSHLKVTAGSHLCKIRR